MERRREGGGRGLTDDDRAPRCAARCDAHAVAEDKVGTVLRVRVLLTGGTEAP